MDPTSSLYTFAGAFWVYHRSRKRLGCVFCAFHLFPPLAGSFLVLFCRTRLPPGVDPQKPHPKRIFKNRGRRSCRPREVQTRNRMTSGAPVKPCLSPFHAFLSEGPRNPFQKIGQKVGKSVSLLSGFGGHQLLGVELLDQLCTQLRACLKKSGHASKYVGSWSPKPPEVQEKRLVFEKIVDLKNDF